MKSYRVKRLISHGWTWNWNEINFANTWKTWIIYVFFSRARLVSFPNDPWQTHADTCNDASMHNTRKLQLHFKIHKTYISSGPLVWMSFKFKLVIIEPILKSISFSHKLCKCVCIIDGLKRKIKFSSINYKAKKTLST